MSQAATASTPPAPAPATAAERPPSVAVRARDVLACEWTKFRAVRSTYWTLLVAAATPIGFSAFIAFALSSAAKGPAPDPLLPGLLSLEYAVLAVSVLGVLTFSSEYSTGLIRTTFAAVPRRRVVLAVKAAVTGAVTLAVGEVVAFVSASCCASAPCSAWPSARSSGILRAASPPPSP